MGLDQELVEILKEATYDGIIVCRECGDSLEPDAEECQCGWINPIRQIGMI